MLCSLSENDSMSDNVSRSGGKRRNHADLTTQIMASQTLSSSKTLKKTRVSMQLDFNSPSGTSRSPVIKKLRDDVIADSKEVALSVQKLLNIAANHQCLSYMEVPKVNYKNNLDQSGQMRAIIPKQLEGLAITERPIIKSNLKCPVHIIKPDAPIILFNEGPGNLRSVKNMKTKLNYLIVLDFESTCWEERRASTPAPEIIEFPAVLVNLQTGKIEEEFQQYVTPTEFPQLSQFCTTLTGISQDKVDKGKPLHTCLGLFNSWVNQVIKVRELELVTAQNVDAKPPAKLFSFVTWTDWDLKICLHQECSRKEYAYPQILRRWIDLKAAFRKNYGWTPKGLRGALEDVGLSFIGREHCGLDDAKNTAFLAYRMLCDGAILEHFTEM